MGQVFTHRTQLHYSQTGYLRVDVEVVRFLKCFALRLRVVEQKALLHDEEPVRVCVHAQVPKSSYVAG